MIDLDKVHALLEAHGTPRQEIYLDLENAAPLAPDVISAMMPYFAQVGYGNPSLTHKPGWEAYEAVMGATERIANFVGAKPSEINYTPGETEANNLALIGYALANRKRGKKIVVSEIEHLSIINCTRILESFGFQVLRTPVDDQGFIKFDSLSDLVDDETILVSIGAVNHEIGTIQPLGEIRAIIQERNPNAALHTDASDAVGKMEFQFAETSADMATLSSQKLLGPRGMGALVVREGLEMERIIEGQLGTQWLWPGVENVPGIVGFAKALEVYVTDLEKQLASMRGMRDMLIGGVLDHTDRTLLNGPSGYRRGVDNVNISFLGCEGEALTVELSIKGTYVSSGSACTRRLLQPSYVLLAIGRGYEEAHGSILMKVNRTHTKEDISYVLEQIPMAVARIRSIGRTGGA